jgi:hypothetical protein
MPAGDVSTAAKELPTLIRSLASLATDYGVSLDAMVLRLRSLGLWNCELSVWYRMTNGNFVLDRIRGGPPADWRWVDESILRLAWDDPKGRSFSGRTFVDFQDCNSNEYAQLVYYETKRRGDSVIALWSKRKFGGIESPLFRKAAHVVKKSITTRPA